MAFERIKELEKLDAKLEKIPKQNFVNYYKKNCEGIEVKRQVFNLIAKQLNLKESSFKATLY